MMDVSVILVIVFGVLIGGVYAGLQLSALRKNEQRQREQGAPSVTGIVPGSMTRVALLLMALVLVEVIVPAQYKTPQFHWALVISVGLAYGVPFGIRIKDMIARK